METCYGNVGAGEITVDSPFISYVEELVAKTPEGPRGRGNRKRGRRCYAGRTARGILEGLTERRRGKRKTARNKKG